MKTSSPFSVPKRWVNFILGGNWGVCSIVYNSFGVLREFSLGQIVVEEKYSRNGAEST